MEKSTLTPEVILRNLANTYDAYTHPTLSQYPTTWVENRSKIDGGAGERIIDNCIESLNQSADQAAKEIKNIMTLITNGLVNNKETSQTYQNAAKACLMFEELYKKDAGITKSLNKAWSGDEISLKQLTTLKDKEPGALNALLRMKRIHEEETATAAATPPSKRPLSPKPK